jgi:hypothetical protein
VKKMILMMSLLCCVNVYGAEKKFKISLSTPKNSPKGSPKPKKVSNDTGGDTSPSKSINNLDQLESQLKQAKSTKNQTEKK